MGGGGGVTTGVFPIAGLEKEYASTLEQALPSAGVDGITNIIYGVTDPPSAPLPNDLLLSRCYTRAIRPDTVIHRVASRFKRIASFERSTRLPYFITLRVYSEHMQLTIYTKPFLLNANNTHYTTLFTPVK